MSSQDVRAAWRSAPTRWALATIAAVCALGWAADLRPLATQWGTVGEWVAGLATGFGLFFAAIQIRDGSRERAAEDERRATAEQERREAQARSVAVYSSAHQKRGKWFLSYRLMNGGDYPIDNVLLAVADPGAAVVDLGNQQGTCLEEVIGTVLPKQTLEGDIPVNFTADPVFGELTSLAQVLFVDTWNQSWVRAHAAHPHPKPGTHVLTAHRAFPASRATASRGFVPRAALPRFAPSASSVLAAAARCLTTTSDNKSTAPTAARVPSLGWTSLLGRSS